MLHHPLVWTMGWYAGLKVSSETKLDVLHQRESLEENKMLIAGNYNAKEDLVQD